MHDNQPCCRPHPEAKPRVALRRRLLSVMLLVTLLLGGMAHADAAVAQAVDAAALPVRLVIPSIGLDAAIEAVGQTPAGEMGVPAAALDVAWYKNGPIPGAAGNAVISGHLDDRYGRAAAFWRLGALHAGDTLTVVDAEGGERTFVVTEVVAYPYAKAPLARIFGFDIRRNLNLITCAGSWNSRSRTYTQRLVVYTRLVE